VYVGWEFETRPAKAPVGEGLGVIGQCGDAQPNAGSFVSFGLIHCYVNIDVLASHAFNL
jgi:hypothetical protein